MKKFAISLAVIALAGAWQMVSAADITGKVILSGTPPAEKNINFADAADPTCSTMAHTVNTTRHYVVGKDNGLANVFIYISKGLEGKTFTPPSTPAEINQEGCMYFPYVTGVMVGQVLKFKNSDPVLHNIHGIPMVEGNSEFNLAQPSQGDVDDKKWLASITKPEVLVRINCDVHKWMFCYVGVRNDPFFAVTDKDGNFKIADVPPGTYTLNAYHLKATAGTPGVTKEVTVASSPVAVDFTLEVPKPK